VALKDNQKSNRTIVLNFTEADYSRFMGEMDFAKGYVDKAYRDHPELFPAAMAGGYVLNGTSRVSSKQGLRMRKLVIGGIGYQIRPSFMLSYMRGRSDEVEKPLFLLRFGVPFWALAYVFGKDPMYWYRLFISLSSYSLVGTSIKQPTALPEDLLADEHHVRIEGKPASVATVCANGLVLGAEAVESVDAQHLQAGYGIFKEEAQNVELSYRPKTVNIDGWQATQKAWRALFPQIFIIECFLHAFLKVRDRATKALQHLFETAADKVWHIYRAETKRHMGQRLRRLYAWTQTQLADCPLKENLIKLCQKRARWLAHLDFPQAYRTSNMLDRLMKFLHRHATAAQMFRGSLKRTTQNFRAFALLCNFTPSCPMVSRASPELPSPAARVNGFVYHQNWLHNLLISASLGGYRYHCKT